MSPAWWVYLAIPVLAGGIGYVTKVLMIEMMFRPLQFTGPVDPWLGWQGQIPRMAPTMAVRTVATLRDNLLDPQELLDLVDPDDLVRELEEPLRDAIATITASVASEYQPTVWAVLPDLAKRNLISRIQSRTPDVLHRLLDDVRDNLALVFDFETAVVDMLVSDRRKLTDLFRGLGGDTFDFMKRAGLVFGLAIGVVQSAALLVTHEELLLPLFGIVTGGLTDWLALQMIFRPVKPGRFLWLPWQGRFHRLRPQITQDYAAMMADHILTPRAVLEQVLTGPLSDRLYHLIEEEVHRAIDEQAPTIARPLVTTLGGDAYRQMKREASRQVLASLPANVKHVEEYTTRTINMRALIAERMDRMTDDQYEGMLRPIFKDQEWLVVVLGSALGFVFGELQLHLLL